MNKKSLRQSMLLKRRLLTSIEINNLSQKMQKFLEYWSIYQSAETIMLYLAMQEEPQTDCLFNNAWQKNKVVCVPHMHAEPGIMDAAIITSFSDLIAGKYGLRVPKRENLSIVSPSKIELVLVPGVAFDIKGNRMGFGAGYYDRFLPKASNAVLVGAAWDFQIVSEIPVEEHDVPMNYLITPSGIIKSCKGKM